MFHDWTNVRRTFKGLIDDFRVYKKAFTATEVQALFGNGSGDGVNSPAPVHFTIAGSESPDNFTAVGLPTGLSVNARTGKITGITTDVGEHNVTVKAGNFLGFSPQQILKINVKPIAPTMSSVADDLTASNVLSTAASINFKIADFGGQDCNVSVYYDTADRGDAGDWQHSQPPIPTWDGCTQYLPHRFDHGCYLSLPGGCTECWWNRVDNDSRYFHHQFLPSTTCAHRIRCQSIDLHFDRCHLDW